VRLPASLEIAIHERRRTMADDTVPTLAPPQPLGPRGAALWNEVTTDYDIDGEGVSFLMAACLTADELHRLEGALAQSDVVTKGSAGQPVAHPLLEAVRKHRELLVSLMARLNLSAGSDWDNLTASERSRKAALARWQR
jgi:hypothetical protein